MRWESRRSRRHSIRSSLQQCISRMSLGADTLLDRRQALSICSH
ncbi:hypothetical protein [Lysobacter gummosus]